MSSSCPDDNEIQGFVEGTLPSGIRGTVALHLEGCEPCRTLLADVSMVAANHIEAEATPPTSRYELRSILGAGGMGVVYEALDRDLGRKVAIKLLSGDPAEGEERARARLQREALALARLAHPNVITVHDVGLLDGDLFVSMELVVGSTLRTWLSSGTHSLRESLSVVRQAAEGLAAAHAAGLVHRDFKPENVLVGDDGRVRVTDFGLARPLSPDDEPGSAPRTVVDGARRTDAVTRAGARAGTPAYMSPEQVAGATLSEASDWYALGATLFEALTGRLPFGTSGRRPGDGSSESVPPSMLAAGISPELDALCVGLLRVDPRRRPSGSEVLARLAATLESGAAAWSEGSPLIAREAHLDRLEAAFATSTRGRAVVLTVRGDSGMGKTALVERFTDHLVRQSRAVVLVGRCHRRRPIAFKGFDGLIESLTKHLRSLPSAEVSELLPSDMPALARIFPALSRVEQVAAVPRRVLDIPDPHELRRRAFSALRECLVRIAARTPLVLWIDDVQWADADSAALAAFLLSSPEPPAVLLVMCVESDHASASTMLDVVWSGTGIGQDTTDILDIEVEPLALDAATSLARAMHRGLPRTTAAQIARQSRGNPYLVAALTRDVAASAQSDPSVPASLDAALRRQIDGLPEEAATLLRMVAVAGGSIDESNLVRAAEATRETATKSLELLRIDHLLRVAREGGALDTFHDRVREVVLASLDPDMTRRLHARLAVVLLAASAEVPEVLVEHFRAAADAEREAEFAVIAADRASQNLAFERAAELYARAIDLAIGPPAELRALAHKRAEALTAAGRWAEAAEARLRLAQDANPTESLQLRTRASEQLLCSGRVDEGTRVIEKVLRAVRVYVPASPLAALVALIVVRVVLALRGYRSRGTMPMSESQRLRFGATFAAGVGLVMVDHVRGQYFQARALLMALDAGEPRQLERAIFMETLSRATAGRRSEARSRTLLAMVRQHALDHPTRYAEAFCAGAEGFVHFFLGDLRATLPCVLQAHQSFLELVGEMFFVNAARSMLCRTLTFQGNLSELRRRMAEARREMHHVGDLHGIASLVGAQSTLHLAADRVDLATRELDYVAGILPASRFVVLHFDHMVASAQTELYAGRPGIAHVHVERAWRRLRRSLLMRVSIMRLAGLSIRGRVRLAQASAGTTEGATLLRSVEGIAERLENEGHAMADGFAAQLRAGVHARRGETQRALACSGAAESAFAQATMKLHAASSRFFRGTLLGGDEGSALVARARDDLVSEGVRTPERFVTMLAPGSGRGGG